MSNTEHFKTLEFTDNRKDTIGKYVHIHDVGGLSFYGSDLPQLMPMTCTMEGLKSFYQSIDFTGIKLVEKHLISVVWDKAIADPATPESTANWQKVGDQDKWLDEVRGRESGEEKIKQRILTAYYAGFNQAHYSHVHPESFEVKECQSAGEEYLLKNEKWIDADLKEYASIVNERKDNIPADFKKITGHDSPKEMAAYEKGREDEQEVIMQWIEKWDGSGNSVMGALLKKVFEK